jgi:hypothetical protein
MPGYANRIVTIHFPELSEPPDDVHVVMRNPKTVPAGELRSSAGDVPTGPDGTPADDDKAESAGYAVLAKLIIGWHVYDGTSTEDDQPLLGLPATPESVGKLPMEILTRLTEELAKVNPQPTPASPGATSSPS